MKFLKHNKNRIINIKNKTILKKLLFAGFTTVIISYIMVAAFLFGMVMNSAKENNVRAIDEKKKLLLRNANEISDYSIEVFMGQWALSLKNYQMALETISQSTNTSIIVFDKSGKIITVAGLNYDQYIGNYLKGNYVDKILKGETVSNAGDIDVFKGQENIITVGKPIISTQVYGGVIISTTATLLNNNYYKSFLIQFGCSVGISIIITFILFYVLSKKITKPIKQIDKTVTEFSKGKFDLRVECNTRDELDSLSKNINNMATSIENLEKMRSSFVSNVSHELRTPMTSITGFVEGMLDGTIPDEKKDEYLKIVLDESKRLSRLVNELLNISRLESGSFKIEKENFNICELMRLTIIKFEQQIISNNLNVSLELENDDMMVFADRDAITQVLTNLIGNAVKFTPVNGQISLKIYNAFDIINVEILNTGDGIKDDKLKYIWDRFYKADDSRNANPEGIGLGLYIVKSIINKSDEKIFVESVINEYTKFTFTLKKA